jgi:hypothetical protein
MYMSPAHPTKFVPAAAALLLLILSTGCQASKTGSLSVPRGRPAAIDGTLVPGEWDTARIETFADGSELLLMHDQGYLYLGIRGATPEMIVGNVFIQQGDEIRILHTSAALGTAVYTRGTENWQQTQAFDWRCRRTDSSETAQAERDAFLQQEGWTSINARMGAPNELEVQIKLSSPPFRLAANLLRSSAPSVKHVWPSDLDDDTTRPTPGGLPPQMSFSPDHWAEIDVS